MSKSPNSGSMQGGIAPKYQSAGNAKMPGPSKLGGGIAAKTQSSTVPRISGDAGSGPSKLGGGITAKYQSSGKTPGKNDSSVTLKGNL